MPISDIFYSWQSDLPSALNLDFIEGSLIRAAKRIRDDDSISIEPVVDRDTVGVPGAPEIVSTIFAKIAASDVFVCDVSIINQGRQPRPTPNPNVLIELGYALKTHGLERIILVMNTAFGTPSQLPFDLRSKRVLQYELHENASDQNSKADELTRSLEDALKSILLKIEISPRPQSFGEQPTANEVIRLINDNHPAVTSTLRKYLQLAKTEINEAAPEITSTPEIDEAYVDKLNETVDLIVPMMHVYQAAALSPNPNTCAEVYKSFSSFLESYRKPLGFSGSYSEFEFDFHRFLGHELFVSFFSFLVADSKWDQIGDLLETEFYVENTRRGTPGLVPYYEVSDYVRILDYRNKRLELRRRSLHADLLKDRHSDTHISDIIPIRQFMDADLLFYLRDGFRWRPWSSLYMGNVPPRYLVEATSAKYAAKLLELFKVNSVEDLRAQVANTLPDLRRLYPHPLDLRPLEDYDPSTIGTR